MKLLRVPAHDLSKRCRDLARVRACHLFKHHAVAVALNELHGNAEVQQAPDCFSRHRARKDIAPDHDMVYFCLTNIFEHRLKCWEVRMNIVNCSDTHNSPSSQSGRWRALDTQRLYDGKILRRFFTKLSAVQELQETGLRLIEFA